MKRIRPLELCGARPAGLLDPRLPAERGRRAQAGHDLSGLNSRAQARGSTPDGSGNVIAVWRQLDDDVAAIRAAFRPRGGSVPGESVRISVPAAAAESPDVAMDKLGNAVAVGQAVRRRARRASSKPQSGRRAASGARPRPCRLPASPRSAPTRRSAEGQATAVWVANESRVPVVRSASRTMTGPWS